MIREKLIRSAHLGRKDHAGFIEESREYFSSETRMLEDRSFFAKLADVANGMFTQEAFDKRLAQYRGAQETPITAQDIPAVVELTAKKFNFNEEESNSILGHLIKGANLTKWGLAEAITRAAQDLPSYDRSTELESIGGQVIELAPSEWKVLAV
jgi:hypothetical protein